MRIISGSKITTAYVINGTPQERATVVIMADNKEEFKMVFANEKEAKQFLFTSVSYAIKQNTVLTISQTEC